LVSLRGGCKVNEHLILTASLDNLLNETYRYHGSGSNEPGFGATLGATVKF
jgi:hemoglobin/transferrin/lactoferrin receptor protein